MDDPAVDDAVHRAMVRGRLAVDSYYEEMTSMHGEVVWHEVEATNCLLRAAHPDIRVIQFTQRQEGGSPRNTGLGADWLWWWLDPAGPCFGVLIQAKCFVQKRGTWSVDISYKKRRQISDLLAAADQLRVPAGYVLYCGPASHRHDLTCGSAHSDGPGDRCQRAGVSFIPALMARQLSAWNSIKERQMASDVFAWSSPLEDLVDPASGPHRVHDLNLQVMSQDLRDFLATAQRGPASVTAKKVFAMVSRMRMGAFTAATLDCGPTNAVSPVFETLPQDRGHFDVPYIDHVLRGYVARPPQYVSDILAGNSMVSVPWPSIAGIVLVGA